MRIEGLFVLNFNVDYFRPVFQGVKAGHYDRANPNITSENFPSNRETGIKKIQLRLVHFNRKISTDKALRGLDRQGPRPATLQECLAFGERFPTFQSKFPTAFLDSPWLDLEGRLRCPYLH